MAKMDEYNMHVAGETNGFGVKATGDYAATAKRSQAGSQATAMDQMSNGSMDYLSAENRKRTSDVKKIRRSSCNNGY